MQQKLSFGKNNPENWRVTGTEAPYSLHCILEYINSIQNFRQSGELRLMICLNSSNEAIGTLDLFEANFKHKRAGIGVLIAQKNERNKGYAKESLVLLIEYAKSVLDFHSLFANVLNDNHESIKLFEGCDFNLVGSKKEWFLENGKWIDERIYQKLLI
jgi:diamine N-acetyltransferase